MFSRRSKSLSTRLKKIKNKNMLLVVPDNSSFRKPILSALKRLGFKAFEFDYRKTNLTEKIFFLISKILPFTREIAIQNINTRLINKAKKIDASTIFVVKGELIQPETVSYLNRKGLITINWYPDYFNNDTKIITSIKAYKFAFQSDAYEISKLRKKGFENVNYLPFAAETVPPKKRFTKLYPITFIGSYSPDREKILASLEGMPLYIWGNSMWAKSSLKDHFRGKWLNQSEMLNVFYRSKVIVNIHQAKSKKTEGANLRCFEVTGAKQFLLSDFRKDLTNLFEVEKEIVCYKDLKDLKEKVLYFLKNEQERTNIAQKGFARVNLEHTYDKRLIKMFSIINSKSLE